MGTSMGKNHFQGEKLRRLYLTSIKLNNKRIFKSELCEKIMVFYIWFYLKTYLWTTMEHNEISWFHYVELNTRASIEAYFGIYFYFIPLGVELIGPILNIEETP